MQVQSWQASLCIEAQSHKVLSFPEHLEKAVRMQHPHLTGVWKQMAV